MTGLLAFLDELQRRNSNELAFYPIAALERALERGEIQIALENGEPCGYLWHGPARAGRDVVIYQAAIHYDLRRRHHGARLAAALEELAQDAGATGIRLRCRSTLDANEFWRALGYGCIAVGPSGIRRNTEVNTWRRPIQAGLFDGLTLEPSRAREERMAYIRQGATRNRWNRHRTPAA